MDVCLPGGGGDGLHGELLAVVPVGDVLGQGSVEEDQSEVRIRSRGQMRCCDWSPVEEDGLLGHDAELGPDPGHVQRRDVVVLEREEARAEVVEPLYELHHRGLAAPGLAHQRYLHAGLYTETIRGSW